jgi:hypothetical protein
VAVVMGIEGLAEPSRRGGRLAYGHSLLKARRVARVGGWWAT